MRSSAYLTTKGVQKEDMLFSEINTLPDHLPCVGELYLCHNLSSIFDECHNYIYANEGILKDKTFQEMVKILAMKLYDEQNSTGGALRFGITASEYGNLMNGVSNSFQTRIAELFHVVTKQYPQFFAHDSLKLKPLTLAYIVGRLQYINFMKTPGDVKGEAFQTFVHRHQRGDRGEFFTPHPVVRLAVEMMEPKANELLIDPACGSGGFLIQAAAYVHRNNPGIVLSSYIRKCIRGIEFNPDVALSAAIRLSFEGGLGSEITCANSLLENPQLDGVFDVVLTNPPFGSRGKVEDQNILSSYELAHKWIKISNDTWRAAKEVMYGQSPEVLFIEKSIKLLKPGGRMGIVLPDGLLQNLTSSHVRFWMRSQSKVLGVVSIPQEAFVPYGTGIKTSLLFLRKLPSTNSGNCFMSCLQKIGYDVKGQAIFKRDASGGIIRDVSGTPVVDNDVDVISSSYAKFKSGQELAQSVQVWTVAEQSLNSRLDAEYYDPEVRRIIAYLKNNGAKPLGEIADILSRTDDFRLIADDEIRYIAISDVDARTMQVVSHQKMKSHEAPSRATYRLKKGDIITAISGASTGTDRHASALITEDEDNAICSNGFAVLRNIRKITPLFLLAYMRSKYYLRQVRRLLTGHAIPAISTEDLATVLVPVPAQSEQARISKSIAALQLLRRKALDLANKVLVDVESVIDRNQYSSHSK